MPNNMRTDPETIQELAALHALGALGGEAAEAFSGLLAGNADARSEALAFGGVVEALAKSLPQTHRPSPGLKERSCGRCKPQKPERRSRSA